MSDSDYNNGPSRTLFKENDKILELIRQRNDVIRELTNKINENNKKKQDKLTVVLQHYDVMEELQKLQTEHINELKRILEEQTAMINDESTGGKKRKTRKVKKGKKTKKSKKSRKYKK